MQSKNIRSMSKSKQSRKAQVIKQTNKQIKGQSKISRFILPTKLSGVGGVQAKTKTKFKTHIPSTNNSPGNSSELEKPN